MVYPKAIELMIAELSKAQKKHPEWPSDILHAIAILQEEIGELQRAAVNWNYENGNQEEIIKEALQCGAMLFRVLAHMDSYKKINQMSQTIFL
jgi:hypothetical protein